MRSNKNGSRISASNICEIYDQLIRIADRNSEEVASSLDLLKVGGLRIEPIDDGIARAAGELRAKYYNKRSSPVSAADCVAAATARSIKASLATSDSHLLELCRSESIAVIALDDSPRRRT